MTKPNSFEIVTWTAYGSCKGYAHAGQRDGAALKDQVPVPLDEEHCKGRSNYAKAARYFRDEKGCTHMGIYREPFRGSKQYQVYVYVGYRRT